MNSLYVRYEHPDGWKLRHQRNDPRVLNCGSRVRDSGRPTLNDRGRDGIDQSVQLYGIRYYRKPGRLPPVSSLGSDVSHPSSFATWWGSHCGSFCISLTPFLIPDIRWSAITHWLVAIFNICDYTRFITDMTSETFGLCESHVTTPTRIQEGVIYTVTSLSDVGIIYIQKGIELLVFEFADSSTAGWFSVVVAMLFALVVYFLERTGTLPFGRMLHSLSKCALGSLTILLPLSFLGAKGPQRLFVRHRHHLLHWIRALVGSLLSSSSIGTLPHFLLLQPRVPQRGGNRILAHHTFFPTFHQVRFFRLGLHLGRTF